jgi:hypothetical protein
MGNAHPASSDRKQCSGSSPVREGAAWDQEWDAERTELLEENARLRGLVVQLSTLVLRNVVDQHTTTPTVPLRRSRPD